MGYLIIRIVQRTRAARQLGPVAQLGARTVRIRKVEGSIPFRSTKKPLNETFGGFFHPL